MEELEFTLTYKNVFAVVDGGSNGKIATNIHRYEIHEIEDQYEHYICFVVVV